MFPVAFSGVVYREEKCIKESKSEKYNSSAVSSLRPVLSITFALITAMSVQRLVNFTG